jgi:hypothetical protein
MGNLTRQTILPLVLVSLAGATWLGCKKPALTDREIATQVLAEYLKTNLHPKAIGVISNPFSQTPGRATQVYQFEKAGIAGLERGFGKGAALKVVFPKPRPEVLQNPASVPLDPKTTTPLSFLIRAEAFGEAIKEVPNCDLVISLIGLPSNVNQMDAWTKPGSPRFALLLPDCRVIGDLATVRAAFASGKIAAAVLPKPGAIGSGTVSSDYRAHFETRFLLVTPQNANEVIAKAPQLFAF